MDRFSIPLVGFAGGLGDGPLAVPAWVVVALGAFVVAVVVASLGLLLRRRPPENQGR
jgi:hypothetical protein